MEQEKFNQLLENLNNWSINSKELAEKFAELTQEQMIEIANIEPIKFAYAATFAVETDNFDKEKIINCINTAVLSDGRSYSEFKSSNLINENNKKDFREAAINSKIFPSYLKAYGDSGFKDFTIEEQKKIAIENKDMFYVEPEKFSESIKQEVFRQLTKEYLELESEEKKVEFLQRNIDVTDGTPNFTKKWEKGEILIGFIASLEKDNISLELKKDFLAHAYRGLAYIKDGYFGAGNPTSFKGIIDAYYDITYDKLKEKDISLLDKSTDNVHLFKLKSAIDKIGKRLEIDNIELDIKKIESFKETIMNLNVNISQEKLMNKFVDLGFSKNDANELRKAVMKENKLRIKDIFSKQISSIPNKEEKAMLETAKNITLLGGNPLYIEQEGIGELDIDNWIKELNLRNTVLELCKQLDLGEESIQKVNNKLLSLNIKEAVQIIDYSIKNREQLSIHSAAKVGFILSDNIPLENINKLVEGQLETKLNLPKHEESKFDITKEKLLEDKFPEQISQVFSDNVPGIDTLSLTEQITEQIKNGPDSISNSFNVSKYLPLEKEEFTIQEVIDSLAKTTKEYLMIIKGKSEKEVDAQLESLTKDNILLEQSQNLKFDILSQGPGRDNMLFDRYQNHKKNPDIDIPGIK